MFYKKTALAALAAVFLLTNCKKSEISSASDSESVMSLATSRRTVQEGSDYLIICKSQGVSARVLEKINALGSVSQSFNEIGVVAASSANAGFKAELEKMPEIQSVMPDLKLNWLKTFDESKVEEMGSEESVSEETLTSGGMGLSGTNPLVPFQWSLLSVDAKAAFDAKYKGAGSVVAVLDGGFHLQHPDIKANIIGTPKSFVPGQGAQMAIPTRFSHGTHVAGIIAAADNNLGIAGIAPAAKLMLVKVLTDNGSGAFSWMIQGVMYAADNGADIINMSLGGFLPRNGKFVDDNGTPNDPSDDVIVNEAREIQELIVALNRAFQYARSKGSLAIAAAGNSAIHVTGQGQGSFYPANCTNVVSIAANSPKNWALNKNTSLFEPASYTNTGSSLISFSAPGGDSDGSNAPANLLGFVAPARIFDMVLSSASMTALGGGSYSWAQGTSMACPAASGVAALLVGKYGGNISPAQLESKLKASAIDMGTPDKDAFYGMGHVNAGNAVKQ